MGNSSKTIGNRTACLGILMLETRFPRILGDIGNPDTWPFPVIYKTVSGATSDRVVRKQGEGLAQEFLQAAAYLEAEGADGIATSCGFLALFQNLLTEHVGIPVAASSLMQIPLLQRMLPGRQRVGVITIDSDSLTPRHFECVGADPLTPVVDTKCGKEFSRAILGDETTLDVDAAEQDLLDAGERLVREHSDIGAVVLECTNMAPYAASLARHIDRPVHDIVSFLIWFQSGLAPRRFC